MKRSLDISQRLKSFEGQYLKVSEDSEILFDLKFGLMRYIRIAQSPAMGLSEEDLNTAYTMGFLIGSANTTVILTSEQYDVLKKLCDKGKFTYPGNQDEDYAFGLEARKQIKDMVDQAEIIKEDKKEGKDEQ